MNSTKQQHTAEPWAVSSDGSEARGNLTFYIDAPDRKSHFVAILQGPDKEANARRIVACVNACAGVPTATLEAAAQLPAVSESLNGYLDMKAQRDKLLAALNEAADLLVGAEIPATKFLTLIAEIEAAK